MAVTVDGRMKDNRFLNFQQFHRFSAMTTPPLTLNLADGSVRFSFSISAAQELQASLGALKSQWQTATVQAGIPTRLVTPHKAFNRNIGSLAGTRVAPDGRVLSQNEWNAMVDQWLPTAADRAYVASLMGRVVEPGKFANWIAPPAMGVNRQTADFEYVRFN